jgi:hypothetical protein
MAGGDSYRLARTRDAILLMVRAIREGYKVLQELEIPIVPAGHKLLRMVPEPILVPLVGRIFKREKMAELIGHAHAARDEMKQIADEFRILAQSTSVQTPAIDRLYSYTDPNARPVADGSDLILMKWRAV